MYPALDVASVPLWQRGLSLVGLLVMVLLAWALSYDRKRFPTRIVAYGVGLQLVFGVLVLRTSAGLWLFSKLNDGVGRLLSFTSEGSRFLFGDYLDDHFTVALNVLPTIVFFSALMSVLYHLGLMQKVVMGVAWAMQRTLKTSGAETLSAAANIFVGQTEAPLVVKPFIGKMTESEIMAVMVGGFATVAGGVMAAYVGMLSAHFPDIAGHLIAASVMSAPAALVVAKVIRPEVGTPETAGTLELRDEKPFANVIDAAAGGASDGMKLALNVAAMLLAFLALVAMVNWVFALPGTLHDESVVQSLVDALREAGLEVSSCVEPSGRDAMLACASDARVALVGAGIDPSVHGYLWEPLTLQRLVGWLGWPLAFVMGVPVADCATVSAMLGERIILNEFVSYLRLADNLAGANPISHRSAVITTYALCGFANIGSIGIQLGGIGSVAPERRADLARMGTRAMLGGLLASYMTACVAGILV
jgi:CNT family concentrative nucleoside transporter